LREKQPNDTNIKKLINTGTIDPYTSFWGAVKTQYIKDQYNEPIVENNALSSLYPTRFSEASSSKIIIGGMTKDIEAYYDSDGSYLAGKSTTIITSDKYNLKPLTALLNSSVCTFIAKDHKGMELAGGYLKIGPPLIKDIPVASGLLIEKDQENELTKIVDELEMLNSNKIKFEKIWKEWCKKLSVKGKDLFSILDDDHTEISRGKDDDAWFKDAKYYPSTGKAELEKEYDEFNFDIDFGDQKIIFTDSSMTEIFFIKFKDLESLSHIYLSLIETKESGKRVSSLKELLEKTTIPLVTPNYNKNTKNIVAKTIADFQNIKDNNSPDNIIEIINKIKELSAEADYKIITLYDLDKEQASTVLDSMSVTNNYKLKILNKFNS